MIKLRESPVVNRPSGYGQIFMCVDSSQMHWRISTQRAGQPEAVHVALKQSSKKHRLRGTDESHQMAASGLYELGRGVWQQYAFFEWPQLGVQFAPAT
jgi:hypothetical protein